MTDIISNELEVYDTGTVTCTTTTDVHNTSRRIQGEIVKIEALTSASSDVKIYVDASDSNTRALVDQYIIGASGAAVTVNTTAVWYPVIAQVVAAAAATTDPDQYSRFFVDDKIEISWSNVVSDDTYRVLIYYKPMRVTKK